MKLRTKLIIGLAFIVVSFLSLGAGTIRRENRNSDGSDLCHGEMPDVWQNHGRKF